MDGSNYEDAWGPVRSAIDRLIEGGERSLPRVLHRSMIDWMAPYGGRGAAFGKPVELPPPAMHLARHAFRIETLFNACEPDTRLIAELGAGWGYNLFGLFLAGGPLSAAYRALEPTSAGRACVETLAALEPALDVLAAPFDYRRPDYGALPPGSGHALVCTMHSIEQIPVLSEEVITGLFGLAERVTGVHFEPIGWQMGAQSEVGATEDYARARGYNENLWPLLKDLERRGEITVTTAQPDIIGHKRRNVDSLVIWTRNAR